MKQLQCLAAAAVAVTAATAIASAASAATANASPAKIRQVPCRSTTFNVHYGINREACYEGTGVLAVRIPDVHRITTGVNTGILEIREIGLIITKFHAHQILTPPPSRHAELLVIDITRA
jgi:hypothetical protein